VDDALLVSVLDAFADLHEQLEGALALLEPGAGRSRAVMGSPLTYSIAKYGRPCGVVPPSEDRRQ